MYGAWRLAPLRTIGVQGKAHIQKHQLKRGISSFQQGLKENTEKEEELVSSESQFNSAMSSSGNKEAEMRAVLNEQRQRRIARREAFVQWQAGQREKGAAHRLVRQAKTQEKFKRHHYHTQRGRLIPVNLSRPDEARESWIPVSGIETYQDHLREAVSTSDFLVQQRSKTERSTLRLNLQKR